MAFLTDTYEQPKSSSNYLRFKEWDVKFRILSDAITWWLDWDNNKPIRTKEKPEQSVDASRPAKHFRAFVVWNYDEKKIQICEITQKVLQTAIMWLYKDEDFGDPKWYDLKITKTGKDLDTKYQVKALNKSEPSAEITQAYFDAWVRLDALFQWADPFKSF